MTIGRTGASCSGRRSTCATCGSSTSPPAADADLLVQARAHAEPVPGRLRGDRVEFDAPQPRVAPGQVVALYDGDRLLGGGIAA